MNLKRWFLGILLVCANVGLAQQSMDFTVRYNGGLNRYEVFCLPSFTQNNFTWGPSQITVVVPASVPNAPLPGLFPVAGGGWNDNSLIFAPAAQPGSDFHGVGSLGALTNVVANQELMIFYFALPGGCVPGVRLFINGVDPDSSAPGMGFGDFGNSIDNGNITEIYNANYNNTGSNCIDAVNDNVGPIAGTGGNTGVNVLTNDSGNGVTPINPAIVVLTPGTNPDISIAPNGDIIIEPNTPAGTYTIPYTICEVGNPTNCDNAVVTVTVEAAEIIAVNDAFGPTNGLIGSTNVGNALLNDSLGGVVVSISDVTITTVTPATPNGVNPNVPVLNPATGIVSVPAGTPAGNYTIGYTLCENLNLATNCDPATITVTVTAAPIIANNDSFGPTNGSVANPNVGNVLNNDLLNGSPVTTTNVTITSITPASPIGGNPNVPSLNMTTGVVSVPAGTPAGDYTILYTLCETLNITNNCDPATVTITVTAAPIVANDDSFGPTNGSIANPNVGNVLNNDLLNGSPVTTTNVTITSVTPASPIGGNPNVPSLNMTTGVVSVPAGTPAGDYTILYTLCETLNITNNCDPATVTITVTAAPIVANDDTFGPVNGMTGSTSAGNAFSNDLLNGAPVVANQITATVTSPATPINGGPVPVMNTTTGIVSVPAGTPEGPYTISYLICQNLNPANCDPAVITINVSAAPIIANDDTVGPINGSNGNPIAGNVLPNDLLNGSPVNINDIDLTVVTPATPINGGPVPTIDPATGNVIVPVGTPAGPYTIVYSICEELNPTNCNDATVTINVTAAPIVANDDNYSASPINGVIGGTVGAIFGNDLLNNNPLNVALVTFSVNPALPAGISINPTTGLISVAPGTPAGTYTINYQICEILNSSNCDPATITVVVLGADIIANDDNYSATPINDVTGFTGLFNVLSNDTYNGAPVTPANVVLTPDPTNNPAFVINPNGTIDLVDLSIPGGTYTIGYTICDATLSTNCDPATVTLVLEDKSVSLDVLLQGALFGTNTGIMRDNLRTNNVIPLLNPYSPAFYINGNARFARPDNSTAETINASLLATSGNDAIVDWVFIELRSATNPNTVLRTQAALVQRDGTIVGATGSSKLFFANLTDGSYYVSVKHRNHLGAMSAVPVTFVNRRLIFDFTTAAPAAVWNNTAPYQNFEMVLDIPSNKYALWAGDLNSNGQVKYQGPQNDLSTNLQAVLNYPTNTLDNPNFDLAIPVYSNGDVNLDAKVKYQGGAGNDLAFVLFNVVNKYIGFNTTTVYNFNVFFEQTPN